MFASVLKKTGCCLLILTSVFSGNAQSCRSLKQVGSELLKALEKRDTAQYHTLRDDSLYLRTAKADPSLVNVIPYLLDGFLQNNDRHRVQFGNLCDALSAFCKTNTFRLKLVSVKIADTFPDDHMIKDHNVEIVFKANKKKVRILTVVSQLNGCYYLFEPVMADLLTEGN